MSKPIVLTEPQWRRVLEEIRNDYPPSIFLIRDRMRKALGFTTREHTEWNPKVHRTELTIRLDFYDEPKRLMFILKYSELLDKRQGELE